MCNQHGFLKYSGLLLFIIECIWAAGWLAVVIWFNIWNVTILDIVEQSLFDCWFHIFIVAVTIPALILLYRQEKEKRLKIPYPFYFVLLGISTFSDVRGVIQAVFRIKPIVDALPSDRHYQWIVLICFASAAMALSIMEIIWYISFLQHEFEVHKGSKSDFKISDTNAPIRLSVNKGWKTSKIK